jgi:hypothetical protein
MDEINLMGQDDDDENDDSTASMTRMANSHHHTHIDHRVVAGEEFTFADVLSRVDDNDGDLATLIFRQTGQNMKNFDIIVDDDTGDSHQKECVREQLIPRALLLLPSSAHTNLSQVCDACPSWAPDDREAV